MQSFNKNHLALGLLFTLLQGFTSPTMAAQDAFLYRPEVVNSQARIETTVYPNVVVYDSILGTPRTVPVTVRKLAEARGRLPVVIWAHGGDDQPAGRNPTTVMEEWATATARAGYLSISVLHVANTQLDELKLCKAIGYPVAESSAAIASTLHDLTNAIAGLGTVNIQAIIAQYPSILGHLNVVADAIEDTLERQVLNTLADYLNGCRLANVMWNRPLDIQAVVNKLHDPALASLIDTDRIALAGHSNGTNSVLQSVGMVRALPNGIKIPVPFPVGHEKRPIAIVALSPMGPNGKGLFETAPWKNGSTDWQEHSWKGLLDIPIMTLTGDGDLRCSNRFVCEDDTGSRSMIPFARMPAGDKYLMYISDRLADKIVASHSVFGSLQKKCQDGNTQQCEDTEQWLVSSVLAFLDAYVRNINAAKVWLGSDFLDRASENIAHISKK